MVVKIKRLVESATLPKEANPGDAGLDLTATSRAESADDNPMVA